MNTKPCITCKHKRDEYCSLTATEDYATRLSFERSTVMVPLIYLLEWRKSCGPKGRYWEGV